MPDPLQQLSSDHDGLFSPPPHHPIPPSSPTPLFGTQYAAGQIAARSTGRRHAQILQLLRTAGPLTMPEIAHRLGVSPNQISGRFTEMAGDGRIIATRQTRPSPATGAPSTIYQLPTSPSPNLPIESPSPRADPGDLLGYPDTLTLPDGTFDRLPLDPADTAPGLPYVRRGPVRLSQRVILITCPRCGTPLRQVQSQPRKQYRCGGKDCNHTWETALAHSPGGPDLIAMVLRTL